MRMSGLPEDEETPTVRIAIGVSKDHTNLHALKWALENVVPMNGKLFLIHVQSPVWRVPNALGAKFPIEKVDPEMVRRYKTHRLLETQKLLDKYRKLCDRRKIQTEVCYSESTSVQKELVSQVLGLGITKLILGISSQSLLFRALKKDSISGYVAKYSPAFCSVIVVNKGKVCLAKPATEALSLHCSSPFSENDSIASSLIETTADNDDACNEDSRTRADMRNGDVNSFSRMQTGPSTSSWASSGTASRCSLSFDGCDHETTELPHDEYWCTTLLNGGRFSDGIQEDYSDLVHKVTEHKSNCIKTLSKAKATDDTGVYREALAALKVAERDHAKIRKRLAEEVTRCKKTQMELEEAKRELACAKDQAETEQRHHDNTLTILKDLTGKLEVEYQRRKDAEKMASQEVLAKLAALDALKKKPQGCYEYAFEELQSATNNFNEENKLGEDGGCPVYKGFLHHMTVAIKVMANGHQDFQEEVELLNLIRHPHIVTLLGACSERGCIVYEYMANGSLEDRLNRRGGTPPLPWYVRFMVCLEMVTALLFLRSHPKFLCHCGLKTANILFDSHFVSKLGGVGLVRALLSCTKDNVSAEASQYSDPDYHCSGIESCNCDVYALGIIMLQLLTGRSSAEVANLATKVETIGSIANILDYSAGDWPFEIATKLMQVALQCTRSRKEFQKLEMDILPVLKSIQSAVDVTALLSKEPIIPSAFFCPIYKEIMNDPYMAADGFTYEHQAIKLWLQSNDTSPMTNLRLDHKNLTPNYTMRSAVKDWHSRGQI